MPNVQRWPLPQGDGERPNGSGGAKLENPDANKAAFWPLASGFWLLASGLWPLASGLWLLASGFWLLASGLWLLASGLWLLASGFWLFPNPAGPAETGYARRQRRSLSAAG
ncbi:MAG: hypothetical protein DCF21_07525 [Leptolyngbya sp.]|nr:MAG: hypothetical protein DCF21_07525 [Leptolyngbya sp.]